MPFDQLKRREFITLFGGAAAWPIAARAQQAMPVIGWLHARSPASDELDVAALWQGLNEVGYVDGQNVAVEYRWARDRYEQLPALAADLVRRQVALIVSPSLPAALAAQAATATIPIVFNSGGDPVKYGLVASLSRPGANLTGVSTLTATLNAKRLELLRELVPKAALIAFVVNPNNPNSEEIEDLQATAQAVGQPILVLEAGSERDLDTAFATAVRHRATGLLLHADAFLVGRRDQIVALAARHAVPVIYSSRETVAAGGLIGYGASRSDVFRQMAAYIGRILKGAKPADLPVMQPTKFNLVINLKTAKALGLEVPTTLLARADEVIE
jgi:ABC-type uncharacterized transport system substrate-binding protein